jgi:hypothetical protein
VHVGRPPDARLRRRWRHRRSQNVDEPAVPFVTVEPLRLVDGLVLREELDTGGGNAVS